MQYLLSDVEYRSLLEANERGAAEQKATLQDLCTKVACYMPAGVEWIGKENPWGCILAEDEEKRTEHCDECPVQKQCPCERKDWSK